MGLPKERDLYSILTSREANFEGSKLMVMGMWEQTLNGQCRAYLEDLRMRISFCFIVQDSVNLRLHIANYYLTPLLHDLRSFLTHWLKNVKILLLPDSRI